MPHQAARLRRREEREVPKESFAQGELCARSELASRLEAKQLVGAQGDTRVYRMAGRWDTNFHRSDAQTSRWRDAVPPVAPITSALPAHSAVVSCGTCRHDPSGVRVKG